MRNNDDEPWYNNNMTQADLPDLYGEKVYVLSSTCPGAIKVMDYLLDSGEVVRGIGTDIRNQVVHWVTYDKDVYLGVGVQHV
jgi:hypothetical protein